MTETGLLPDWVRLLWVGVLCVVGLLHTQHLVTMRGRVRYWHAGHVLMAVGMASMYLPPPARFVPPAVAVAVFGAACAVSVAAVVLVRLRTGTTELLWLLSGVEMAAMVYMLPPLSARSVPLSVAIAAYLVVVGALWAAGRLDRHYPPRSAIRPRPEHHRTTTALRFSLCAMALGMAHMLVAM